MIIGAPRGREEVLLGHQGVFGAFGIGLHDATRVGEWVRRPILIGQAIDRWR